ncbi:hypothetical protein ACFQY0_03020 [Haloferula chungangensis]|uniref:Toprim domain-containing protein n=1 Tax=Haloferula chungangensis TaxID=1048331 RepID=A0ABW2L3S8_9BACT
MKDIFAEANATYTITALWSMLRLPGNPPRPGTKFASPFRPDSNPSCDISKDDRWFADRSQGLNLNGVGFVHHALGGDWVEVRAWFLERLGIDHGDAPPAPAPTTKPEREKQIIWPGELVEGTEETWNAFAKKMNLHPNAAMVAVQLGMLRFLKIDGIRCYAITDTANKAAEIRRCDGKSFGQSKAYPLKGVEKKWLPGADLLKRSPNAKGILITEGPRDLLTAISHYYRYRRNHGGTNSWQPMALLGASCKELHSELVPWFRGRHCRLVPDADGAGDRMAAHWESKLFNLGCKVDVVRLQPRGKDLTDLADIIQPEVIFS